MTIGAPIRKVVGITGKIEFADGSEVEFGVGYETDWANGDQPYIGMSVDVRRTIVEALEDQEFWHRGDEDDEDEEEEVDD